MNREEKKQERIERYEELAHKAHHQSNAAYCQSSNMVRVIPMGQPILVGHHSEAGHRRLLDRSWNKMGESVKLQEKAEYYQQKAEAVANNNAIYSDDDEAVGKLEKKIAMLEEAQEMMKNANKIIRLKKLTIEEKKEQLRSLGFTEKNIDAMFIPNCFREIGYPSYSLTNNNANIRRLKKRLEDVKRLKTTEVKEYEIKGVQVVENAPENRLQLFFKEKPDEKIRGKLKELGFRWSPTNMCWQSYFNRWQVRSATEFLEML